MRVGGITTVNTAVISEVTFQQRPGGEGMSHVDIWGRAEQIQQDFSIWALLTIWVRPFLVVREAIVYNFSRLVKVKQ